ncbi:MAG: hypothetical protein JSU85_04470 [Candidatus Zixiibacteriota bacterium]|nr:MAG: hypothetical protein JSU85_04470 [candidate division Zixibacteria bacterium]
MIDSEMNIIFDTVFALNPAAGDIASFYLNLHSGEHLVFRTWFYDENRHPLYRAVESVNINEYFPENIILQPVQTGFRSGMNVKILRDLPPWDSYGLDSTLAGIGLTIGTGESQFSVYSSSDLPSIEFAPGADIMIISNDQPQGFYNNLSSNLNIITEFAGSGGTILWETCDLAWNYGSYAIAGIDSFPGGITHRTSYDATNTISDPDLYLVDGLSDTLTGAYASNKHFWEVPDSAIVYMKDSDSNPTLIGLKYGSGIILYSGQPLEYNFDRRNEYNIGFLLPRIIGFLLGIQWQEPSLRSPGRVTQSRIESQKDIND